MPAQPESYAIASGEVLSAGRFRGSVRDIASDGIWTWFADPRAVYRNGATYIMAMDSVGHCLILKHVHATGVTASYDLSGYLEIDDHNNGSLIFLSDGRIVAFFGLHNDPAHRYRVSTNPEDISAWSAVQIRGEAGGPYSYPQPFILSIHPAKQWLFFRRYTDGTGTTRSLAFRTSPDFGTVPATISAYTDVLRETGARPYCKSVSDGVNKIHFCATSAHPNEATYTSINHFCMQVDASGNPTFHKSDGTQITAPFVVSDMTRVDSGSDMKRWNSDIAIGSDGHPRILWMRYPNNNGTDIRYMYSRWTGAEWTEVEICADGAGLYTVEPYYHGGLCFDAHDADVIYLSAPISGVREIQQWRTNDNGATWSKVRDITSGTSSGVLNGRPYSPRDYVGMPVIWWSGRYTSYSDYETAVKGLR